MVKYIDYCNQSVTPNKLVTWDLLEKSISLKLQHIDSWKQDWSVKFNLINEVNNGINMMWYQKNELESTLSIKLNLILI